jgi:hypothetical protein
MYGQVIVSVHVTQKSFRSQVIGNQPCAWYSLGCRIMRTSTASLVRKSKKDMPSEEVKKYSIICQNLGTRHDSAV